MNEDRGEWPLLSPVSVAIRNACPRCGEGKLYSAMLTPAAGCRVCGLDYSFIDSGDGPAVFVILILGFVILGLALLFETIFSPPLWVHFIIWLPVVAVMSVWALRFAKTLLIALQYRTSAREGSVD